MLTNLPNYLINYYEPQLCAVCLSLFVIYCSADYDWWLVLICCKRKVLLTDWWLVLI